MAINFECAQYSMLNAEYKSRPLFRQIKEHNISGAIKMKKIEQKTVL